MQYGKYTKVAIVTTLISMIFGCSGSQTNNAGKKTLQGDVTQQYDATQTNKLILEGGSLKGTEVSIPAGALANGATVDVREGQAQFANNPAVSSGNVTAASQPLAVTASADGSSVASLQNPMTINLPISNTSLHLAVERAEANLCVLLQSSDNVSYVWRRASIAVTNNVVKFDSSKLGIFQLFYCGSENIEGASDAASSEIAGSASVPLAKITIPGSGDFNFNFSHTHICMAILDVATNGIIGSVDTTVTAGTEKAITIMKALDTDTSTLADTQSLMVKILYQTDSQKCEASIATGTHTEPIANGEISFLTTGDKIKAASLAGTLGDSSGSYPLGTLTLKIGRSDNAAAASPASANVCLLASSSGGSNGGTFKGLASITSDSKINSADSISIPYVLDNNATTNTLDLYNQTNLCNVPDAKNSDTAQPSSSRFPTFTNGSTLHFVPIDISISGIGTAPSLLFPKICVRVFSLADDTSGMSESQKQSSTLTQLLMNTKDSATYKLVVPFVNEGKFAFGFKMLSSSDGTCTTETSETIVSAPTDLSVPYGVDPKQYTDQL